MATHESVCSTDILHFTLQHDWQLLDLDVHVRKPVPTANNTSCAHQRLGQQTYLLDALLEGCQVWVSVRCSLPQVPVCIEAHGPVAAESGSLRGPAAEELCC
jgi:hypothetical protein